MALPIKETPILRGKEAKKFIERMNSAHERKISKEEYEKAKEIYEKMKELPV